MTTKQLVHKVKRGDPRAQRLLVDRYSGMLMTVCIRYCHDKSGAKDALQETFIRVFRFIEKYKETGSFEAWLRKIAVRSSLKELRRSWHHNEVTPDVLPEDDQRDPEVDAHIDYMELMDLIHELPIGFRTVLNLHAIEGLSHKEIGELLSISAATSRSQLTRARQMLKKKLADHHKFLHI